MINPLGNANGLSIDAEHLKIIRELRKLGEGSSGNMQVDSQKLTEAKTELVERLRNRENQDSSQSLGVQVINQVDDADFSKRAEMEEQRLGAMTVAELNKIFFGL